MVQWGEGTVGLWDVRTMRLCNDEVMGGWTMEDGMMGLWDSMVVGGWDDGTRV